MTADQPITHDPAGVDAMLDALNRVFGRHLGTMVGADEADEVLTHLDNAGWVVTTTDEWVTAPTAELDTTPDVRVVINVNIDADRLAHPTNLPLILGQAVAVARASLDTEG